MTRRDTVFTIFRRGKYLKHILTNEILIQNNDTYHTANVLVFFLSVVADNVILFNILPYFWAYVQN